MKKKWEERFDEKFLLFLDSLEFEGDNEEWIKGFKNFISQELNQARKDSFDNGYLKGCKEGVTEWRKKEKFDNEMIATLARKEERERVINQLPTLWAEHRAEVSHAMEYGTEKDIPHFFEWLKEIRKNFPKE